LVWVRDLEVCDLRNIRRAGMDLHPGLNVFVGRNAQGKTSLLEAVGLLARGRSFRTEDTKALIRYGATTLLARASASADARDCALEVELERGSRRFRVDGREVSPREYHGRLEVVVYSTDRLRVVRGPMRDRRLFLDRGAAALWPAYRQASREFDRVLAQRNAALADRRPDLPAWNERFVDLGSRLRARRAAYVERLRRALQAPPDFRPAGETYDVSLGPELRSTSEASQRTLLAAALERALPQEMRAGRSLLGPHRDAVALTVDGQDAGEAASAGQARCLLLALALATLAVHREETGQSAVALLDDLDSELDDERADHLCTEVAARGQALVTTAHPDWAGRVSHLGRVFHVSAGEVRCA
jgi:DNA replication and repair protein RecF